MKLAEEKRARTDAWSSYWSSGVLHSCATSYSDNYGGAVGDFWARIFSGLEAGDRMLDLATGNGALPRLALSASTARLAGIDAVDLAQLVPAGDAVPEHLRFHSGVALESLPFEDGAFDLVTSQFGIEYARWPDAVHEALRVCRRGARLAFVVHHVDSVLLRVAREEREHLRFLLPADGLVAAAAAVLPWAERARGNPALPEDDAMRGARMDYNAVMQRVSERLASSSVPDVLAEARQQIHGLLGAVRSGSVDADSALRAVETYRNGLQASMLRTDDLLASAKDPDAIEWLAGVLRESGDGRTVAVGELTQAEGLLGWSIEAYSG